MGIFSQCVFYLDPNARLSTLSLTDEAKSQDFADSETHALRLTLQDCGGTVLSEFDANRCTHYVTDSAGEGCTGAVDISKLRTGSKCRFQVVSPDWINRCLRRARLLSWCNGMDDERHVFSTVIACLSGFRGADRTRIWEQIVRGGGAVTTDLTSNCTHLVTSELRGDKCRKAMDMDINIVPAMWVTRSLQNRRKEDEDSYCARKPLEALVQVATDPLLYHGQEVFSGMRFFIEEHDDTVLDAVCDNTLLDAVRDGGGLQVESVDEATHIIADSNSDADAAQVVYPLRPSPARRTRAWLLECAKLHTTVWPTRVLEWKGWRFLPRPRHAIPMTAGEDVAQFVITLTGYTGIQRDVLKTLIRVTGAECTDALTKKNTHLLCNNPTSKKAVAAAQWGIRVVNHLWIMDSVLTWAWQPAEKYDRAGEDIIEEGGWTLLGDSSAHAKSLHPRFLTEKTWPLPAAQIEEDAQIAGTPEEALEVEAARSQHDSNGSNAIAETQSQDGAAAGHGRQHLSWSSGAEASVSAPDDQTCAAADEPNASASPCLDEDAPGSMQWPVHRASASQRNSDGMSSALRPSVSLSAKQPELVSAEKTSRMPQRRKDDDDSEPVAQGATKGKKEEEAVSCQRSKNEEEGELNLFLYKPAVTEKAPAQPDYSKKKKQDEPFASQAASNVLCQLGADTGERKEGKEGEDDENDDGMEADEQEMAEGGHVKSPLQNSQNTSSAGIAQARPEDGIADKREAASPVFGESASVPIGSVSHAVNSSISKRCLVREFQYDLDDDGSPEARSQNELGVADGGGEVLGDERVAASSAVVVCDSPLQAQAGVPGRSRRKTSLQVGKASVPSRAAGDPTGASTGTVATGSATVPMVQDAANRARKRGKAKEKSVDVEQNADMLENILDGHYESMAFGNYEDPAAMESVAFDGNYNHSVSGSVPTPVATQPKGSSRRNAPRARASGAVDNADAVTSTSPSAQVSGPLPSKSKASRACRGEAGAAAVSPAAEAVMATSSTVSTPAAAPESRKAGKRGRPRKAAEIASGATAAEKEDSGSVREDEGSAEQGLAQKKTLALKEGAVDRRGRARAPATAVEESGKRWSQSLPGDRKKRSSGEADLNLELDNVKTKAGRSARAGNAQPLPMASAASRSSPGRRSTDASGASGSEDFADSPGTRRASGSSSTRPSPILPSRFDGSTSGECALGTRRVAASKEREGATEGDGKGDVPSRRVLGKRPSPSSEEKEPKSAHTSMQVSQEQREAPTKADASFSRSKPASPPTGCARVISGTRVATKSKFVLVCGKSAERAEQQAAVQQLGGQSAHLHGYTEHATHILVKELRRTEKFLCACAAGRWILKPGYILSCKLNGQWLQEQSYEWNNPRKVDKEQKDLWHGAPRRWRQYWEQNHEGPFAKFKCLLMPESHPPHDVLTKIISAGSGQVVLQEQEPTLAQVQKQVNEQGVTHVVVSESCDRTISKWLDSSKVPYFKGDYLMDFLAHKSKPSPNDSIYKPELVEKRSGLAGGSGRAKSPARGRS